MSEHWIRFDEKIKETFLGLSDIHIRQLKTSTRQNSNCTQSRSTEEKEHFGCSNYPYFCLLTFVFTPVKSMKNGNHFHPIMKRRKGLLGGVMSEKTQEDPNVFFKIKNKNNF